MAQPQPPQDNPFVPVYSEQSDAQKKKVGMIKGVALDLYNEICTEPRDPDGSQSNNKVNNPRHMAMAKSYLEIAVMLAVKGVTNPVTIGETTGETTKNPQLPPQQGGPVPTV